MIRTRSNDQGKRGILEPHLVKLSVKSTGLRRLQNGYFGHAGFDVICKIALLFSNC
ncbi:Protein of unknown function [Thermobacillus xylanilyticus]|uniref:Transposase n=1 Tax=Thermobacillus xylanilyticus TaxID=76633 RepID=A0ABN7S2F3_THEXY|nr:Protein of unknown function [Thermobacillus xylanilyticus]